MDAIVNRLYYRDAYLREFDARVVEQYETDRGIGVVLDRSAFYPTSGGQPHDTGLLNSVPVVEVFERIPDAAVVHVLERRLESDVVQGMVDWPRRFDMMQQHTGQHVLSHAFESVVDADTVGFHLTEDNLTIDVNRAPLSADDCGLVEQCANEVVWADLPVHADFVRREELARLPLRKPPVISGPVRIVRIDQRDFSPCGGTHCSATGSVGQILIRKVERRGSETRIDFVCGGRALAEARRKLRLVGELAAQFSVGDRELLESITRLGEDARSCRRELKLAEERLLDREAAELYTGGEQIGATRLIVRRFDDRNVAAVKYIAQRLMAEPSCVALIGAVQGGSAQLTFARSDELPLDVRPLLRDACRLIGGGGGGQPNLAQGGGSRIDEVDSALHAAAQAVKTQLHG